MYCFQLGVAYAMVMEDSRKTPDMNWFRSLIRVTGNELQNAKQRLINGLDGYYEQLHAFCNSKC